MDFKISKKEEALRAKGEPGSPLDGSISRIFRRSSRHFQAISIVFKAFLGVKSHEVPALGAREQVHDP